MLLALIGLIGCSVTGCAEKPGLQHGLWGHANTPCTQYKPLRIDPNKLAAMSQAECDMIEYSAERLVNKIIDALDF